MLTRECRACGRMIPLTPSDHLRAHACPHGKCCVPSYVARRRGVRGRTCAICKAGRQLELFPDDQGKAGRGTKSPMDLTP